MALINHEIDGNGFNPRSPRGGATESKGAQQRTTFVSIHAPHEGERRFVERMDSMKIYVSIHAPHEGERHFLPKSDTISVKFQSTLPTRGSDLKIL